MSKNKDAMTDERWTYLKGLVQNAGNFFHVSKTFVQRPRPDAPQIWYWHPNPGTTYNIGRNAKKRTARLRRLPSL
jgi:hypothetical protein